MSDRKMNNPSWCCEKIQELIEEYKKKSNDIYDTNIESSYLLDKIVEDLESILYE